MAAKKGGLGKGLDFLFDENATDGNGEVTLAINDIEPNRKQPRKDFDEESLAELADSIRTHGLLQPVVVRPLPGGTYEIVAGERRWRACRMAGVEQIPVIIKELNEQSVAELALVENLQREDLNPYEEAKGFDDLMNRFGLTQEEVARRVGRSRAAVANALRLLKLPTDMVNALREGSINAGQARALLSCEDPDKRQALFKMALEGASVRTLEALAKQKTPVKRPATKPGDETYFTEVALALKGALHRPVRVVATGKDKGRITLEFYSREELTEFAQRLCRDEEP